MHKPINFQINGSFEHATNPDIPDYWSGTGRFYRSNGLPAEICDEAGINDYREKFYLDRTTSFDGSHAIRIERPFQLLGMQMDVVPEQDYTVSLYLKGAFPHRQVRMAVTARDTLSPVAEKIIHVGEDWTRHELHLANYAHRQLSIHVLPLDSGKIWIDAVQIEIGSEATPFKPSPYDANFNLPQPVVHPPATVDLSTVPTLVLGEKVDAPPAVDGLMRESFWMTSPVITLNDYMGPPADVSTQVRVAHDETAVYFHFTLADPAHARGIQDSVEIFFDVLGVGDPYYQFIFDAEGTKRNFRSMHGLHEWEWQADWQVATRMGDGEWTAEVAIPFAAMPDTATLARIDTLRMQIARNYAPGPEKYVSWVPVNVGFLEPDRFGRVMLGRDASVVTVSDVALGIDDARDALFTLGFHVDAPGLRDQPMSIAVTLEQNGEAAQVRTGAVTLESDDGQSVSLPGFKLVDTRCRVTLVLSNADGRVLAKTRQFIDVPHVLRLYTEYSYYTTEDEARVVAELNRPADRSGHDQLTLVLRVAGHPHEVVRKTFPLTGDDRMRVLSIPLGRVTSGHIHELEGRLTDRDGGLITRATTRLYKYEPNQTEVKVNRINRGLYLNGEPYIPYGIMARYGTQQLRFYKNAGFDFIKFNSHWHSIASGMEFLADCEGLGIHVMAAHLARGGRPSIIEALPRFREAKSLIGVMPNDEESDRQVYDTALRSKILNPYTLNAVNHNISSYRAFANRLEGFPGDVLSIDRYPLLGLPKGRPHTISEIYSVERCIEIMDRDGARERMPLLFWLQGAERFSKEPTPTELTWMNYILLVNRCVGFTYFGGMPASRHVWDRMVSLNKEIQRIKPFLFTFDSDPEVRFGNETSRQFIRVLPKVLDHELLLICVNRAMEPVDAVLDLSAIEGVAPGSASVWFEGRSVPVSADHVLQDRFEPLERHVYRIKLDSK